MTHMLELHQNGHWNQILAVDILYSFVMSAYGGNGKYRLAH
jgi:hypothetical protein